MPPRERLLFTEPVGHRDLLASIEELARPLRTPRDLDPLIETIGDARFVLLGEASHGTHEYYAWRTAITRRLVEEKGFNLIAVEGDWPDCYAVNRYVKGYADSGLTVQEVLQTFRRWPTWMWGNEEIVSLAEWLRGHNDEVADDQQVGFYGLDVYSLWDSLYRVMGYVAQHRPDTLAAARQVFECFEPYGEDVQDYARATLWGDTSCEDEVVAMLTTLAQPAGQQLADGSDARFNAEQNALVVHNAERYYRAMVRGNETSWNVRDRHMVETLDRLVDFHGSDAKAIVWEHNTHIGDARFTDMLDTGMVNVGQLVRQRHEEEGVVLVGFGSHSGSVIAGKSWEAPMERMRVPEARLGSWEDLLHRAGADDKLLIFDSSVVTAEMLEPRGHRAIGVVYHPQREGYGNYVPSVLPRRYDAFLFIDQSRALQPLREVSAARGAELPETFPSGI